ncbi:MBL fold metallo-hydrolase, partial [Candidatus Bipolaricaulota bacterium]|nr:MBL fold metallo-hydrolase [Candidatus Bipolaricaulota bacterium]
FANQLEKHGFTDVKALAGGMEAWSGVYDRVPIATEANDLTIVQLQRRAKGCLGYLVGSNRAGVAAAVDVSRYTKEFLDAATEKGFKITHVFDTHIHADHISGGRELADKLGVDYHLGERAEERDPEFDYLPVQKNEVIDVGSISIKAIHTPGHTTEMTSWLVGTEALISGDSLFANSIGRTELEFQKEARKGADLQYQSLVGKVLSLPDEVKVLPGHFSISNEGEAQGVTPGTPIFASLGKLRKHNKALQMNQDEFVEYIFENVPEKPPNYEEVIATNLGRQKRMSQQKEVELEMGPNRCATSEDSMVG